MGRRAGRDPEGSRGGDWNEPRRAPYLSGLREIRQAVGCQIRPPDMPRAPGDVTGLGE